MGLPFRTFLKFLNALVQYKILKDLPPLFLSRVPSGSLSTLNRLFFLTLFYDNQYESRFFEGMKCGLPSLALFHLASRMLMFDTNRIFNPR